MNTLPIESEIYNASILTQQKIFLNGLFFENLITISKAWDLTKGRKYLIDIVETIDSFLTVMSEFESKNNKIYRSVIRRSYAPTNTTIDQSHEQPEKQVHEQSEKQSYEQSGKQFSQETIQEQIEEQIEEQIGEQKTEKNEAENDEPLDPEDEYEERFAIKQITVQSYAEKFASPFIISNWCALLQDYQTLDLNIIYSIVSLFQKISDSIFQPMLFQVLNKHFFYYQLSHFSLNFPGFSSEIV